MRTRSISGWTSELIGRSYPRGSLIAGSCHAQIRISYLDRHPAGHVKGRPHTILRHRVECRLDSSRAVPDPTCCGLEKPALKCSRKGAERSALELHRVVG